MFIAFLLSTQRVSRFLYISIYLVIFIVAIMTGRTAWIGIVFSCCILVWNFRSKLALKSMLQGIIVIILANIVILSLSKLMFPSIYSTIVDRIIPYAFEMFINLFHKGEMATNSTNILNNMYFPLGEPTLLFGDGYYKAPDQSGAYYMGTDAGYMRQVLFYGLLPSVILYLFYLQGFYFIFKGIKKYKSSGILVIALCLYFFIVQYKGAFLTGSAMNIKLFLTLLVFSILSHQPISCRNKSTQSNS
ncbi:MAG: hypothetical protein ACI9LM_004218 [Alteromonadaceae bacterium]|jgi:hypothetical protein